MKEIDETVLAARLLTPVHRAGRATLAFRTRGGSFESKADRSPVTQADRESEMILLQALHAIAPGVPVLAEEAFASGKDAKLGDAFFLVDPLDGTRDFIDGQREYTINVALVRDGEPSFGLIYAPVLGEMFFTVGPRRAVRVALDPHAEPKDLQDHAQTPLHTRKPPANGLSVLVSRSHLDANTEAYLKQFTVAERASFGSSLKFCRIAEGKADLYPRLARTMEWDTAAGECILRAAGGDVLDPEGGRLAYGKADAHFANPGFVAWGRAPQGSRLLK